MLKVKRGYENAFVSFKVGQATFNLKTEDITEDHIEKFKNHIDLSYFVEPMEVVYVPEEHDVETVLQNYLDLQEQPKDEPKKKRTRKKK